MRSSNSSVSRHPRQSHSRTNTIVSSGNSSRNLARSSAREDAHRRLQEHRGGEENVLANIQVLDNAVNRTPLPLQQRGPHMVSAGGGGGGRNTVTGSVMRTHDTDFTTSSLFQSSILNSFSDNKYASMRQGGGGGGMWASRRQSTSGSGSSSSIISLSLANMDSTSFPDTNSSIQYGGTSGWTGEDTQHSYGRTGGMGGALRSQRVMDEAIGAKPKPLTENEYRAWWKQRTTVTLRETLTIFLFHNQDMIVSSENPNEVQAVMERHEELEKQQEIHRLDEGTKFQEKGTITFVAPQKSIHCEIHPPVKVNAVPLQVTTWMLKDAFSSLLADEDDEDGEKKGKRGKDGGDGDDKDLDEDDDNDDDDEDNEEEEEEEAGRGGVEDEEDDNDDDEDDSDVRHPPHHGRSGDPTDSSVVEKSGAGTVGGSRNGRSGLVRSRANRKWLMADSLMSNLRIMERAVVQNYMEHLQLKYRGLTMDPSCYRYAVGPSASCSAGGGRGILNATGGTGKRATPDKMNDTLNPLWGAGEGGESANTSVHPTLLPPHPGGDGGPGRAGGDHDPTTTTAGGSSVPPPAGGLFPSVPGAGSSTSTTAASGKTGTVLVPTATTTAAVAGNNTTLPGTAGVPGTPLHSAPATASGMGMTAVGAAAGRLGGPVGMLEEVDEYRTVPEVEMSPEMELLWRFRSPLTANRRVTCMAWNRKVTDVLVVGYSAVKSTLVQGGGSGNGRGDAGGRRSRRNSGAGPGGLSGGGNEKQDARRKSSLRWGSREAESHAGGGPGGGASGRAAGRRGSVRAGEGRPSSARRGEKNGEEEASGERPTDRRGLVCCWSLKNPLAPELALHLGTDASVSAVAFSYEHPSLLAVGNTDGGIVVYDIQRDMATPSIVPAVSSGQHTGAVWELKWVARGKERGEFLMSVSADGRVVQWAVGKCIEKVAPDLMHLTRQPGHPSESSCHIFVDGVAQADMAAGKGNGAVATTNGNGKNRKKGEGGAGGVGRTKEAVLSRQCGGMCFDVCPTDSAIYVVGTEDGSVYQCNKSQTESYDLDYAPHAELVYRIRWSPYSPLFFLTCSADWTTRVYRLDQAKPMLKLDSPNQDAVQDVAWSYTNALHFATVTVQGNVEIWTLLDTIYPRWLIQYKDRRRLNAVLFAEQETPVIVVGDEEGEVCVFALTSYVFTRQELLDDEQERILEEAIRKQQS